MKIYVRPKVCFRLRNIFLWYKIFYYYVVAAIGELACKFRGISWIRLSCLYLRAIRDWRHRATSARIQQRRVAKRARIFVSARDEQTQPLVKPRTSPTTTFSPARSVGIERVRTKVARAPRALVSSMSRFIYSLSDASYSLCSRPSPKKTNAIRSSKLSLLYFHSFIFHRRVLFWILIFLMPDNTFGLYQSLNNFSL